jgi:hypothetical protein
MKQSEVDPARDQEHARKQIIELLRHVAREMVRRIAIESTSTPKDAEIVSFKHGSAHRKGER